MFYSDHFSLLSSKHFVANGHIPSQRKHFVLSGRISFDKEVSSISLYEDSSLVFLKIFPFGTNSIYNDVSQLCSLKPNEIKSILKKLNLTNKDNQGNKYVEKDFFTESEFKKLSISHLNDIIKSRVKEMLDYIFNTLK